MTNSNPLAQVNLDWQPASNENSQIARFSEFASHRTGRDLTQSYADLWRWSVEELDDFWATIWDFYGLPERNINDPVISLEQMPGAVWFPNNSVNYTTEIFRGPDLSSTALIEIDESMRQEEITWGQLQAEVAAFAQSLTRHGIVAGDRVVGYLPNRREAIVSLLGSAAIGATWALCGLEYPSPAAISRLSQLEPRALITTTRQVFSGQERDLSNNVSELITGLPSLEIVIHARDSVALPEQSVQQFLWTKWVAEPAVFAPVHLKFDHPLWVLFSSGTTGTPKGIVHGHGGIVLEYLKLAGLHLDLKPGDRLFWYTSPSWMMWNYITSSLVSGATVVLYDGSPAYPNADQVFRVAEATDSNVIGMSPAYLESLRGKNMQLSISPHLRSAGITGSVFGPETHEWFRGQVGGNVQIFSSSGGTDIASGFAGSAPNLPSWIGELSAAHLGVALDAFDSEGNSVRDEVGELVVTRPMPSMPLRFWNDQDGSRYHNAYFDTYPGVWRHGDWITITSRGSVIIHGRSDATLNRYGVRMGSADIYGPVESLSEIREALVLGVELKSGDYWMPLFVVLAEGVELDDALRDHIKLAIRNGASPRHVPDEIIAVPAIPHTRTGKKLEVPLKKLFQSDATTQVADVEAVDSAEALNWFVDYARNRG